MPLGITKDALRTSPQDVYILGLMDVFWVNVLDVLKTYCLEDIFRTRRVPAGTFETATKSPPFCWILSANESSVMTMVELRLKIPLLPRLNYSSLVSYNGLDPNMPQAIILTNDDVLYWRICVPLPQWVNIYFHRCCLVCRYVVVCCYVL